MARSYTSACISNYTGQRANGLTGKRTKAAKANPCPGDSPLPLLKEVFR
jgi:hypothetical protein